MDLNFILSSTSTTFVSLLLLAMTGVFILFYNGQRRCISLPPGPKGYPFIGNIFDMPPSKIRTAFRKFRTEYGDLFSVYMGRNLVVVVNGYDNLKELFSKRGDAVSDRPPLFAFSDIFKGLGVVGSSGQLWKVHRSFASKTLRNFGFGKESVKSNIMEEVRVFLKEIERHDGKPFNVHDLTVTCVSNVICSIVFGHRFDHEDKKFKTLLSLLKDIQKHSGIAMIISMFPALKSLPGDPFAGKRLIEDITSMMDFIQNFITEHEMCFDPENLHDFIDVYLKEKTLRCGPEKSTFTDVQLAAILRDMFMAGIDTTTTIIKWFVLYLLHNPNIQGKMAAEIDAIVGLSRLPSLGDRPNLPYCEAVITEVMRCANISFLSLMHSANEDVNMNGYTIPKGACLIQNLDSVMMDPILFPNPEEFRPERFIDNEGNFGNYEKVIPFSVGRRVCLGENLARIELFLFSVSMVQRFRLLPVQGKPLPPLKGNVGIIYKPNAYEFTAIKRQW